MKNIIVSALFILLLSFVNLALAEKGIYAELSLGGEKGIVQANGNGELLISQQDGTKNGIWEINNKAYVGFKQPDNAWTVFDPSGMGQGFTPPPQPETKVTIEKTGEKITVANITGTRYKVTSEEDSKVENGYMIASKDKLVREFTEKFFNLMTAAQKSARGQGPSTGMEDMERELRKRGLGVLEFGDDTGENTFKVTVLDRRNVDIKLPAEPGDPFANIGGPGIGDLGMGGSGPNGAPTEADIERMQKEMMEKFKQHEVDQANAQKQAEKEWLEKEARKKAEREASEAAPAVAGEMSASDAVGVVTENAEVASENQQAPVEDAPKEKIDVKKTLDSVKEMFKGWGR